MNAKLGEIAEFINGGAWSDKEYTDIGIPVVKVTNLKNGTVDLSEVNYIPESSLDKYSKHLLRKGDLVIATVGSHPNLIASAAGRATIIPIHAEGALLNQNALCIRTKSDNLHQGYLGYLGKSVDFQGYVKSVGRGAANQVRIALGLIKEFEFDLPLLHSQHRIASILSAYDDLIENNLKRIKLLEEKAFLSYKGIMNGEKLERKKLKDVLDLKYGKALKADDRKDGKYPVLGSSGVVGTNEAFYVKAPGIIVGRKGNIGSVYWSDDDFWPIDTVYYVESALSLFFLYFNLKEQHFVNTDAAVPGLNRNFALDNWINIPTHKSITAFDQEAKSTFALMAILRKQNNKLREARDILLPRLMSGEIEV
jgi:type I restriction enzyme S subunit